jgi:hypothetical protein
MGWATFWAIFSQTRAVTLLVAASLTKAEIVSGLDNW